MIKAAAFFILAVFFSSSAYSWTHHPNTRIKVITIWEGSGSNPLYFQREDNVWCYVPAEEIMIHSLILTLYSSGKRADIHCYDRAETKMGGISAAHKIHRIIAK
ncbi:hypothetical protein K6Q96_06990 [Grimontia kaedaensis]|uniref:Uncharacterized protein n=1 Tax=Grimontia kaedaensis TaxID=2872157 RepID=A0ABY4WXL7_9GAMM|nr:hypothetical protein [Grimontia kaedaensis]USH03732.1 hypothetical protein K6Q96_06990 [Grimontia kaedaensis]